MTHDRRDAQSGAVTAAMDMTALCVLGVLTFLATAVALIESFDGLLNWAEDHGLHGWRAYIWPIQIDTFIVIGEAMLVISQLRAWSRKSRAIAWITVLSGAALSVFGNIGHVGGETVWTTKATASVPPLVALVGLSIGLQVIKRIVVPVPQRTMICTGSFGTTSKISGTGVRLPVVLRPAPASGTTSPPRPRPVPRPGTTPRGTTKRSQDRPVPRLSAVPRAVTGGKADDAKARELYRSGQVTSERALAQEMGGPGLRRRARKIIGEVDAEKRAEATS